MYQCVTVVATSSTSTIKPYSIVSMCQEEGPKSSEMGDPPIERKRMETLKMVASALLLLFERK